MPRLFRTSLVCVFLMFFCALFVSAKNDVHSTFKSVSMKDIKVQGNTSACPLIIFNDNKVQSISVNNSEFSSIRAISIYGKATDNITVEKCYFHDNYAICVMCENNCANSRVSYNKFERIGCSVYGNIVMDIENSYGIDLRKSLTLDNIKSGRSNVNNTIYDNIINNKLRFEGRGNDSSSHKGANLIVVGSDGEVPMMVTSSLVEDGADKIVKYSTRKIERKAKRMLRKK